MHISSVNRVLDIFLGSSWFRTNRIVTGYVQLCTFSDALIINNRKLIHGDSICSFYKDRPFLNQRSISVIIIC